MANDYYTESGAPSTSSQATSSTMRSEFALIGDGFDKLPTLSGNGSKIVAVNSGASALEAITTTGTGNGVRATSPTLVTPVLGVATATTINKVTITAPASGSTLTIADGKTLTASNTITFTATDGSTLAIGTGGTLGTAAYTAASAYATAAQTFYIGTTQVAINRTSASLSLTGVSIDGNAATVTTNANLTGPITSTGNATAVASQTGTGSKFVMDTSPTIASATLTTPNIGVATATSVNKVAITAPAASATLTIADGKTLTVSEDFTVSAALTLAGTNSTTMTFPSTNATIARIDAGQTFTGTQVFGTIDVNGGTIDGATVGASSRAAGSFTRVAEDVNALTPGSGAGATVDWAYGGTTITNSGTNALTFSNVPSGTAGHVLRVTNLANSTFPAAVDWGVDGKPTVAGAAVVSMVTFNGGTNVYAAVMHRAV